MHETLLHILKLSLGVAIPLAAFATGLSAANSDPLWLTRHPRLLLRSLLLILIAVPVGVVVFVEAIGAPPLVKAALVIAVISIGIGPPAALSKARSQKDTVAFEVGLNLTLLALAIVYIPLAVAIHGAIFHHAVRLGVGQVAGLVLVKAAVPMLAGVMLGRFFPRLVAPFARYANLIVMVILLAIIVFALVATWRSLLGIGAKTWLICLAIVVGEIALGHAFGSRDPPTRRMLVSFSAMRFPALALLLVSVAPRGRALIPVILAYVITSFVLVAVYSAATSGRRRRETLAAPPRGAPAQSHA